jgi:HlyD family secretion protein
MTRPSPPRRALRALITGTLLALLAGCGPDDLSDAYGTFQATETTVSAQADGRLLTFDVSEGDDLAVGEAVGLVDTTQLATQRDALLAQRRQLLGQKQSLLAQARASVAGADAALAQGAATLAQVAEAEAGADALAAQLATAEEEAARTRRLHADAAATARELNEREGQVAQLRAQVQQARSRAASIRAQAATAGAQARVQTVQAGVPDAQAAALDDQVAGIDAQLAGIADRLARAAVENPAAGTVLTVLAEPGEVVRTGTPLYTVADLAHVTLRAFASGDDYARLRLGMPVEVLVDDGAGGVAARRGEVAWVAARAQFTPTPIQTRDERAELVYAFDVRVPNPEGLLKVGMPGEVRFLDTPAARGGRRPADA